MYCRTDVSAQASKRMSLAGRISGGGADEVDSARPPGRDSGTGQKFDTLLYFLAVFPVGLCELEPLAADFRSNTSATSIGSPRITTSESRTYNANGQFLEPMVLPSSRRRLVFDGFNALRRERHRRPTVPSFPQL